MDKLEIENKIANGIGDGSDLDIIASIKARNENIKNTILNTSTNHAKASLTNSIETLKYNIPEILDIIGTLLNTNKLSLSLQGRITKILGSFFKVIALAGEENSKVLDIDKEFNTIVAELYAARANIINDL